MELDEEYARFMSELDAPEQQPDDAQPASVAAASLAPPTLPLATAPVRPAGAPPSIVAPPSAPEATRPTPSIIQAPSQGPSRPAGPPPSLLLPPAGAPPPFGPPAHLPPPLRSAHGPTAAYGGAAHSGSYHDPYGAGPSAQRYHQQQPHAAPAFNPAFLDTNALRDEILAEKKDGKRKKATGKKEGVLRVAGGEIWIDDKLAGWPENDFRIFVGNLGPEVTEDALAKAFQTYPSYAKCRIVKDYKKKGTKMYGFVSFLDAAEGIKALKQMHGKYIGNRPCQLKKACTEARSAPLDPRKRKAAISNPLDRITTKRTR